MNKGVVLIALGSADYGQMAANLAASLKYNSPDLPVHLIWAENALSLLNDQKKALFTSMQECPYEYYHKGDKTVYVKAKTHLYDLTPFKHTIFLDVDTILLPVKKFSDLFNQFKDIDFTMENRGRVDMAQLNKVSDYLWAEPKLIKAGYGFDQGFLYGLHSEFIYFRKCRKMQKFFTSVKRYFEKPKIKLKHVFDGDVPDEFGFALAMLEHKIYPHACPYIPLYWYLTDKKKGSSMSYVINNYYGYSIGGNRIPEQVQRNYNKTAQAVFQRLGLTAPYKAKQKRSFLASRRTM